MSSSSLSSYPEPSDTVQTFSGIDSDILRADYYDGPFASKPDYAAVRYLKDHSAEKWLRKYDPAWDGTVKLAPTSSDMEEQMAVRLLRKTMHRLRMDREKLAKYNTIDDAVDIIKRSRKIMVLTGAGISVSCGIPDFRSPQGLYARLQAEGKYELDDPQQMFDIEYFKVYPEVFYNLVTMQLIRKRNIPIERYSLTVPSFCELLRNYTQNIDNIEGIVGVKRVFQCHGSFATASCIVCHNKVPGSDIKDDIYAHTIPYCVPCTKRTAGLRKDRMKMKGKRKSAWDHEDEDGSDDTLRHIMKARSPGPLMRRMGMLSGLPHQPDITFFGEKLASDFDELFLQDIRGDDFDCLLIIGTSLEVAPVADIVYRVPHSIPQILINKTPVVHARPDIVLLGDADEIVHYICTRLDWSLQLIPSPKEEPLGKLEEPRRIGDSHVWMFRGAEPGSLLKPSLGSISSSSSLSSLSSVASPSKLQLHKGWIGHGSKRARYG
ncbi:hypothetical protein BS47DRAFT_1395157 [Hydnum rufescens UP504]|uniref:Deacetylase sirtuin-type domain-containing protein n=1 Tax=Hydnum rufescens UP504 TaxID=1448309 RepID=A0A9P6DU79_9AGAM|nr:hypothetical protein BS47DRAFT_1395157 [Hydnum rufescens UP504]